MSSSPAAPVTAGEMKSIHMWDCIPVNVSVKPIKIQCQLIMAVEFEAV